MVKAEMNDTVESIAPKAAYPLVSLQTATFQISQWTASFTQAKQPKVRQVWVAKHGNSFVSQTFQVTAHSSLTYRVKAKGQALTFERLNDYWDTETKR